MSSIKDLFVSIKVKSTGVDKLQELNRVMRTTLSLMKEYNKNIKEKEVSVVLSQNTAGSRLLSWQP